MVEGPPQSTLHIPPPLTHMRPPPPTTLCRNPASRASQGTSRGRSVQTC